MESLITRFEGDEGQRRLREVLSQQAIIGNDDRLLAAVLPVVKLRELAKGAELIRQGEATNSLFFILVGSVAISINGRPVASRSAGKHVGEMALVDPAAPRAATVIASAECVVAEIVESEFVRVAESFPVLWRRIAMELAARLRERGRSLREPNAMPRLFIGSTVEALPTAREIQSALSHDAMVPTVWTDAVFGASTATIESLEKALEDSDFACLVITGDDVVQSRDKEFNAPRDNVVLELGLFMGRLGRGRTFMVRPRGDIKIPTDLNGVTMLDYAKGEERDLAARLGPACTAIRKAINALGPR